MIENKFHLIFFLHFKRGTFPHELLRARIILHSKTVITFTGFGALVFVKTVANCKSQTSA